MIIRNDDVSMSSDFESMLEMYDYIELSIPWAEIWSCVCVFSRGSDGSVYPKEFLPISGNSLDFFLDTDRVWMDQGHNLRKIVSHGLYHAHHGSMSIEAQKMSIVGSCKFLKTDTFVAPFTHYNQDTYKVCSDYGIKLADREMGWKSLESEPFDPEHPLWFFHSWRYTPKTFREMLNASEKFRQLQRDPLCAS